MICELPGGRDVLRGHQPLLDGRPEPSLEHHRTARAPACEQQREVLHVAGADLEDVRVLGNDVDLARLHHLGDHRQPGPLACLGEVAQALDAQALEAVRACPGLECSAADDRRPVCGDEVDRLHQLVAALDRARAGHHRQRAVADHRIQHPDHGVLGVELARHELVRLRDRPDRGDTGHRLEARHQLRAAPADLAHDRDDDAACLRCAARRVLERRQAFGQDEALHSVDLGLSGSGSHHHEHAGQGFLEEIVAREQKSRGPGPLLTRHEPLPGSSVSGIGHAGHLKR